MSTTNGNGHKPPTTGRPILPANGRQPAKTAPAAQGQHETLNRLLELDREHYAKRAAAPQDPQSSYLAGESNRMNPTPAGIDPLGSDADYHYGTARNYYLMMERARAAVRNHPLVEQAVNRLIANLRLTQIRLDPATGDKPLDRLLKEKWLHWTGDKRLCDWEMARDFNSIVSQSFFNEVVDGDILHIPLAMGALQTWEAHHIRSPYLHQSTGQSQNGIMHGAEVRNGRTVGWHVTPASLSYLNRVTRQAGTHFYKQYDPAGNQLAFYAGFTHRFSQRRGISRLSPPRDAMNGFDDLNYAHIKSALRRSLISYLMTSTGPPGPPVMDGEELPQAGARFAEEMGLGLESVIVEQQGEPAQVFKTPRGWDLQGWNANMPGSGYFEQSALLLTMLAVNLDLPLSFLLLDGSLTNFHGGRMTFDQVKLRLEELQRHVIATRHRPTYRWKLRQWTTQGHHEYDPRLAAAVDAGRDLDRVQFRPKGWPYVKPMEDAAAENLAENRQLRSRREILATRGQDIEEVDDEILADRGEYFAKSLEAARGIVAANGDLELDVAKVAAELRYGGGSATGVQLTMAAGDPPPPTNSNNGGPQSA